MAKELIEELKWRGLYFDATPDIEKALDDKNAKAYVGFDPTADSLHIGNFVPIMLLVHFQRYGYTPYILVGGATGMVGDPSGKTQERNLMTIETINYNLECQQKQLRSFISFEGNNAAHLVNNYDWFKNFGFLEFIREVGKHISINYMMAKDSVSKRLETGMSFTEFSYQLIQGYDFYHLYKNENVSIQMGGSDQWGNITTGTELIRRMCGGDAHALTAPLVTKSDGTKFGKSEGGNVWLDASKTSPFKFYQYWLNVTDEDAFKFTKMFTLLSKEEIENIYEEHQKAPHTRLMQKTLAAALTTKIHGEEKLNDALQTSELLFGNITAETVKNLSASIFENIKDVIPFYEVEKSDDMHILDLVSVKTTIFASKGEAKKMIIGGGLMLNKNKIESETFQINSTDLLHGKYLLLQKGKKNYFLIEVK